jgi:oligoendopeptidase F
MVSSTAISIGSTPQEWALTDLYQALDDPHFVEDLAKLDREAAEFQTYRGRVATLQADELAIALQQLEAIYERSGYLYAYPSLIFAANTRDSEAKKCLDKTKETLTTVENQLLFFELELQALSAEQLTSFLSAPALANYHHYLQRQAIYQPHCLAEAVEQTRNQDSLTGRQAFIQLRSIHQGELSYRPLETPTGTVNSDAGLSALLFHGDRTIRHEAYERVREPIAEHNSLYGFILNTIVQDHRLENTMRSYDSTLAKQLVIDEVTEPVFRSIMDGMAAGQPLFQRYYRLKAKALGHPITSADTYAPWGGESSQISYGDGVATLIAALDQFDINYSRRAEEFFAKSWVDAKVRTGKRAGAFCSYTHGKHSYLLLSYTEDYNSLFTLAHEMGHGLHFAWMGDRQSYFNCQPPMVLAEVASTFNELLLLDYLLKKADDRAAQQSLLTRQLEDLLNLLFRQSSISRLELSLHDQAKISSFDASFINQQWQKIYQDLCGDAIEVLPHHQYDWARIGHIFFKPFYCYQYTASSLVSIACYQQYLVQGKDFIPGYLELLGAGSSLDQVTALKQYVNIDLTNPSTISGALSYVESLLNRLEQTL